MQKNEPHTPCSFYRLFVSICYDSLLLISVLFFASFILLPLSVDSAVDSRNIAYQAFLLLLSYLYFCWQWTTGGQTLGMRSWKIYLVNHAGQRPTWPQASIRFFGSICSIMLVGTGFFWALIDNKKLSLHDHLSKTKLIVKT